MSDSEYLALSSTHAIQVNKPKRKVKISKEYNFGYGENAFKYYVEQLDDTFEEIEEEILSELLTQLEEFVAEKKAIFDQDEPSSYRYIPCAMVSISSNIIRTSTFTEHFKTSIEELTPLIVTVTSDDVKNVPGFVALLQNSILEYMEEDSENEKIEPKQPVTVLFEDFDCFDSSALSDLLILMAENLSKLPMILICCKSSDVIALNMRLPARATDCLLIESFSCRTTREFFYTLLNGICLDPDYSFKLGPDIISHLIQVYHLWDTSLDGVFKRIKLCIFEHFFTKPFSRLCCPMEHIDQAISELKEEELQAIKALPSLANWKSPSDSKWLKSYLKEHIPSFRDQLIFTQLELLSYHCLKEILFPKKKLSFLQSTWIPFLGSKCFSDSVDFLDTSLAFLALPSDEIVKLMGEFLVKSDPESTIVVTLKNHFTNFEDKIREEAKADINIYESKLRARKSNGKQINGITRQQLVESLSKSQKTKKKIDLWKTNFLDILKEGIEKVNNPLESPLNEIFFFNDLKSFKQYSIPSTREDVIETLIDPSPVLECKRCQDVKCQQPDITTVYEIYGSCLRVANLKQCFDNFNDAVKRNNNGCSPRKRKKDNGAGQKELLARFLSAIGDLEYIGLLRAHPRKQDHIERLVWPTLDYSQVKVHEDLDDQISNLIDLMALC